MRASSVPLRRSCVWRGPRTRPEQFPRWELCPALANQIGGGGRPNEASHFQFDQLRPPSEAASPEANLLDGFFNLAAR
jgi:hypothetical protein